MSRVNLSQLLRTKGLVLARLLTLVLLCRGNSVPPAVSERGKQSANKKHDTTLNTDRQFYDSGDAFLQTCSAVNRVQPRGQRARDAADARACENYIAGLADGVALQHMWSRSHGDRSAAAFCVQFENVPPARLVDEVLQYLRDNPERRHFRAAIAVEEVLHKKFPCKEEGLR